MPERAKAKEAATKFPADETSLRIIIEKSREAVVVTRKGKVLFANPRLTELTGLTAASIGDDPLTNNLHPEDQHFALQCRERLRSGENAVRFTGRYLKSNGSYLTVEIRAFNVRWDDEEPAQLLFIHDVSQRKELETQLRNNIAEQEAVLNSTLVGVLMSAGYQIRWINRRASDILGYGKYELVDVPLSLVFPSRSLWQEFELESSGLLAAGQSVTIECELRRKDGDVNFCVLHGQPIKSRKRDRVVVWTLLDVSEQKRAERETQSAIKRERELAEVQSRFVAMASHEFRTPLTAILSATELLEHHRDTLSKDDEQEVLTDIRSSVLRMRSLIEGVFTVNRADSGALVCKPQPVNLRDLIENVLVEAKMQHPGTHHVTYEPASGVPEALHIDPELTRIILVNLVGNAIKYSPKGTPVAVSVSIVSDQLAISVRDEGIGIPTADQSRIAKAYFRASNVSGIKGTGLGLTIVRRAVDAHGGVMAIQSEAGKGTTVSVGIPANSTSEKAE
jgi:PAS domain S-box-containing protein